MATHSGILPWKIPWTEKPGRERWAVSSSNRTGVLQRLQAPGPGKEPAGAMTPVLHMRTGSPVALTDLNEATGISNADAQSLSERNYLQ